MVNNYNIEGIPSKNIPQTAATGNNPRNYTKKSIQNNQISGYNKVYGQTKGKKGYGEEDDIPQCENKNF